jgi:thymidylate kinase
MNIIIEGCDGTGKSSIASHLCKMFGMYYWHESQPKTFDEYCQMLEPGGVVFDRFCFGQFVYNEPEQRKLTPEELYRLVHEVFPKTNTVLLYVDAHTETIIERLIARGEGSRTIEEEMVKYIKNIRGTYRSVLRQADAPYIEINGEGGANYNV